MKLLKNFFFHAALLAACAVVMILNVVLTGANNFDDLAIYGKIAGVIFTADIIGYVGVTMAAAIFGKK